MTAIIPEIDAEYVIRGWLEVHTGVITVTETDNDLAANLPQLQVVRIGGGDDGVVLDRPTFSVHAYAATRDAARKLALTARTALYAARGVVFEGAVVTRVATIGGPAWTPYSNTNLRRFTATYQVSIKAA